MVKTTTKLLKYSRHEFFRVHSRFYVGFVLFDL